MDRFLKRLPLPTKLLLIAAIPIIFIAFLTARLFNEKARNIDFIEKYMIRMRQSASVTRLIDELQQERMYSFEYALNRTGADSMIIQRKLTDSALHALEAVEDHLIKDFPQYTFLEKLLSTRKQIDSNSLQAGQVIHFFSSAIFRLNTLNRPPSITYLPLEDVYAEMHFQRLLSELVTYQGIINANVYTVLYTKKYGVETLMGTLGTYDVYKSYQRELELKATAASGLSFDSIRHRNSFKQVDEYLEKLFGTFVFDSTYTSTEWKGLSKRSQNELRTLQMSLLDAVEYDVNNYYESEKRSKTRTLVYLVVVAFLLAFIISYILAAINKNLKQIQRAALRLANGETDIPLQPESNDAIGSLARSIQKVDEKNKELAIAAQQIGKGNFNVEVQPRSGGDMLGNAIVQMKQNLLLSTTDLERSREEFRIIADFVPQIVWTARPDGYIDYYNKQWYEITGAKKQFGDLGWIPVLHPDDVGRCLATWHRSVESGMPYEIEYRFWDHRSQSYRWFLGRALPVRDEAGAILKWFGTGTDIHDQKMQKEQLEELVTQRTLDLKRSNEDLQQFAHVASHDLKEPVRKIRTFSQRLSEEFGTLMPEKGKTYLDKIQVSSERMSAMIDSILSYSVVNATIVEAETVDLNIVLEGIMSDLELLIVQKEAKIHFEKLPRIKGIPTLIYQLFYNLISNSLKFSKPGVPAEIRIQSNEVSPEDVSRFELAKGRAYADITITDNGIGFSQEYADKIFNVFTRLNSRDRYEGTGLGLALCRKIIHRHGGLIFAESEEGIGSSFHLVLPTAKANT